ncbi:hypothetical protein FBU30_006750 [Linnemannia zychae]|nr:hypothetical protein FBU30_006750 [Linnemannia zychae]
MALITSLRHRPAKASSPPSPSSSSPLKTSAATTGTALYLPSPLSLSETTSPSNPAATKIQFSATKKTIPANCSSYDEGIHSGGQHGKSNNNDIDDNSAFIELDCHHILQDMQDTLGDSLHMTNKTVSETWRSTKASANEKIRGVEETWDAASKAALKGAKRLLRFEELPKEWQSNPYILTGYRFLSSKRQCLKSIFRIHNETCNIWTHMLD